MSDVKRECVCCQCIENETKEHHDWKELLPGQWCCCDKCLSIAKSDLDSVE